MTKRLRGIGVALALAIMAGGCASGKAFSRGEQAVRDGKLDEAVAAYREAAQGAPGKPEYQIALQRTMQAAARAHLEKAHEFESQNQLEPALGEYKQASEYDPSNRSAVAKVAELERTIRDRIEASRPRPPIEAMRDRARAASLPPALINFTTPLPRIRWNNASLRDILNSIADVTGINITYDREVTDRQATVQLDGVTLEQALNQLMQQNQLSYKVINERSIFVFQDIATKHGQYDEQVVRVFYVSHADATELTQILSTIVRLPGIAIQPAIVANKAANTITVRATAPVVQILERIIQQNDKPRAEIVVDVSILEVDRSRTKTYGINLSDYALGMVFSPEVSPNGGGAATTPATGTTPTTGVTTTPAIGTTTTSATGSTGPTGVRPPPAFNLNTISRGVSTADFYLAVPTAIANFLESDTHTKIIAKPQLRGAEGGKLTLKLGDSIPIISTSYTPIATGGAGVNPLSSYQYKDVGITVDMTPRVTLEGDILLDLNIEDTSRKSDVVIAGINIPAFGQRSVTTRLRLRDGESNLLAGLFQQQDLDSVKGFPGAIHVPVLKDLFSSNARQSDQTDIVMLLTPHIVRTHEITEDDLKPIYIGSQQNLGVGGPSPLIVQPPVVEPAPVTPGTPPGSNRPIPPNVQRGPGGTTVAAPPGSSPVPGTVLVPTTPAQPAPNIVSSTGPEPAAAAPPPPSAQAPAPAPAAPAPAAQTPASPMTTPGIGGAQILISPPAQPMRVGGGPYNVPLSVANASRISSITLTLVYDPTKVRIRAVQEGSFMRAGGVNVTFTQQAGVNRVDITLVRAADATGASGTGLLASVLLDAIAPGPAVFTASGTAMGPGGVAMSLGFTPATATIQQ
jgi:general secretion pathway protein D